MNILLLANWGIGLEIFKALYNHREVKEITVITQYEKNSTDIWKNALFNYSIERIKNNTICQNQMSLKEIKTVIINKKIDLMITHAYMKILPEHIFSLPIQGTLNIHPSLLPKYRGPAPAKQVLKNREKESGLTCHYMDNGIDTGDIVHQVKITVQETDTVESIIEKEKKLIPNLINESLNRINSSSFIPTKQSTKLNLMNYYPKIPH